MVQTRSLIGQLSSSDPQVRARAAGAVGWKQERRAIPQLQRLLRDRNPEVRYWAVTALGEMEDRRFVPALIAALQDPEPRVRAKAATTLGWLQDSRSVPALASSLRDPNAPVRREAVRALGGNVDASLLLPLTQDGDSEVRAATLEQLARSPTPEVSQRFVAGLKDESPLVRYNAAVCLGLHPTPKALAPLIEALHDREPVVAGIAAWALGETKDTRAVKALLISLHTKGLIIRSESSYAIEKITGREPMLGKKPAVAVYKALEDLKSPQIGVRSNALYALRGVNHPIVIEPLINALDDAYDENRWIAATCLGEYKTPQVVAALTTQLKQPDDHLRQAAAEALARIGALQATEKERSRHGRDP